MSDAKQKPFAFAARMQTYLLDLEEYHAGVDGFATPAGEGSHGPARARPCPAAVIVRRPPENVNFCKKPPIVHRCFNITVIIKINISCIFDLIYIYIYIFFIFYNYFIRRYESINLTSPC